MTRAGSVATGGVVAAGCALVALVAGLFVVAGGQHSSLLSGPRFAGDPVIAEAEVLNSAAPGDGAPRWRRVSLAIPLDRGEVITWVDWPVGLPLPFIGEVVEVVYDSGRPEQAYSTADPYVLDLVDPQEAPELAGAGGGSGVAMARAVFVGASSAAIVIVALTVVAGVRARRRALSAVGVSWSSEASGDGAAPGAAGGEPRWVPGPAPGTVWHLPR